MGKQTAISWTDNTYNPWWGCVKIGAPEGEPSECDNCYAENGSVRFGWSDHGRSGPALWGPGSARRTFGDKHWNEPRAWDAEAMLAGRPQLVFCASYADVFEARDDLDEQRTRLWELIEDTPHLIWQLLTKRPEQVARRVPARWMDGDWPPNVWVGASVGTQRSANLRIPRLLEVPAPVRFLSCEPLLGPVDLTHVGDGFNCLDPADTGHETSGPAGYLSGPTVDWIIIGGETGPGYRRMELWWAKQLAAQAEAHGVPVWFKQVSGSVPGLAGPAELDVLKQLPPQAGERGVPVVIG